MGVTEQFERIVQFYPAWDKRHPDPRQNYGVHGVEILFLLRGPKGAWQFKLYTNWQLPHVRREFDQKALAKARMAGMAESDALDEIDLRVWFHPMPTDVGYHSPVPQYEGQKPISDACEWLNGKPCYYDGSSLQAEEVFETLLREGSDGVWAELERRYREMFEEADAS